MANGNGTKWAIWMAGIIATLMLGSVATLATSVVSNDQAARARDTTQDKETSAVQVAIGQITTAQTYMQRDIDTMRKEQKAGFQDIKEMLKEPR